MDNLATLQTTLQKITQSTKNQEMMHSLGTTHMPCTTCAAYDLRPVHRAFCSRLSLQCSLTQVLQTSRLASWRIEMMIARIGRKEADQLRNLNMAAASCKRGLEVEV